MATVSKCGPAPANSSLPRHYIGACEARMAAVVWAQHHSGRPIHDTVGYPCYGTFCRAGDCLAAKRRREIYKFRRHGRGTGSAERHGAAAAAERGLARAARNARFIAGLRFQSSISIQQPCVGSQGRGDSEHASGGEQAEFGPCRHREHSGRSCSTRLSAHSEGHSCAHRNRFR